MFMNLTSASVGLAVVAIALAGCASTGDLDDTSDEAVASETLSPSQVESESDSRDGDIDDDHGHDHEDSTEDRINSFTGEYELVDVGYGTITTVTLTDTTREIVTNSLPNHETGEFPNSGNPNTISAQDNTWVYPLIAQYTGEASSVRVTGVALNGVKFEPGTAERVTCASGETYNLEALQEVSDLGLDFNNAHVQPGGEYHYHGVSSLLVDIYDQGEDLVLVGFAADGHLIYYSKSDAYQSSYRIMSEDRDGTNCAYQARGTTLEFDSTPDGSLTQDWEYSPSYGDLDQCNGTFVDDQYVYLLTDSYPYVPRCLMGEFSEEALPAIGNRPPPQP